MTSEKFHAKHPGIPIEWQVIGEGGNALVWSDGTNAVKHLKDGASKEAVARFKREAEIMLTLRDQQSLKIVPVKELREREGALEIVMDRMDGNLEKAVDAFAGNPERAAAALEPIASTLAAMSDRQQAIYHRDLKQQTSCSRGTPTTCILRISDVRSLLRMRELRQRGAPWERGHIALPNTQSDPWQMLPRRATFSASARFCGR